MIHVDLWSFQCARCGWKVVSQRTVNYQQRVADVLIRLHIQQHEKEPNRAQAAHIEIQD